MRGIIDGVDIKSQVLGRRGKGGDELIDEQIAKPLERSDGDGIL